MIKLTKNDSWIILSPGRTGSMILCHTLMRIYLQNSIMLTLFNNDESKNLTKIKKGTLVHTHNPFLFQGKNIRYIFSIRDIIESTLSRFIRVHIGKYHIIDDQKVDIVPFYLDPKIFLRKYEIIKSWYYSVPEEILKVATVIDYTHFSDDHTKIIKILDLPELNEDFHKKVPFHQIRKNPGPHSAWIKNWEEIEHIISLIKNLG